MARKYFYDNGEEKIGPVSGNHLVRLRASGEISDDTWVRRADSGTWRPLSSINLRAEEEEEANPSLWRLLMRSMSWSTIFLLIALAIIFIAVIGGLLAFAWPLIPIILFIWFLNRISKL